MPADPVLSRELKSLQEELTATQRQRAMQSADKFAEPAVQTGAGMAVRGETDALARRLKEFTDESQSQLRELVQEITGFVDDAEKNISAHPAMSVVAAMLLGILIGSLLGRR